MTSEDTIFMSRTETNNDASMVPSRAIKVFIAEDHHITRWGLKLLIDAASPAMEVVGTAGSCQELMSHPACATADVILLDLDLGGQDTTTVIADLCRLCSGCILVLTGTDDVDQHRVAMMKGARGVIHKSTAAQTILQAIEKVNSGEVWLQRKLLGEVLGLLTDTVNSATTVPVTHATDPYPRCIADLPVPVPVVVVVVMPEVAITVAAVPVPGNPL